MKNNKKKGKDNLRLFFELSNNDDLVDLLDRWRKKNRFTK